MTLGTKLDPDAVAAQYLMVAQQPRNCWTEELDVRPNVAEW